MREGRGGQSYVHLSRKWLALVLTCSRSTSSLFTTPPPLLHTHDRATAPPLPIPQHPHPDTRRSRQRAIRMEHTVKRSCVLGIIHILKSTPIIYSAAFGANIRSTTDERGPQLSPSKLPSTTPSPPQALQHHTLLRFAEGARDDAAISIERKASGVLRAMAEDAGVWAVVGAARGGGD